MKPYISLIFLLCSISFSSAQHADRMDLNGLWNYRLTGVPSYVAGEGEIALPNTLDNAHKSIYNQESENTSQLRREFSFSGIASYDRNIFIPQEWNDKEITLFIERTKPSLVKIDGKTIGSNSRISSPQRYNLTNYLSPGFHSIEIIVNNADSIPPIVARSSNAVSESTQTNWNGILGDFYLEAKDPFHIKSVVIDDKNVPDDYTLTINLSKPSLQGYSVSIKINGIVSATIPIKPGADKVTTTLPIKMLDLWSANNPILHSFAFELKDDKGDVKDIFQTSTGLRNFSTLERNFSINGQPIFLRGTTNAAVFPITAHTPTDYESWEEYFFSLKEYGINHVRFHSWTPPEAAFSAADKTGVYILTELPIWGELDRDLKFHNAFLQEDLKGIMEAYSHHPSFVMFSPGTELWGDISLMGEYKNKAAELNPRILTTYGSNVYLGMNGQIGGEDFIVASKTGDSIEKSVRGSMSFADSQTGGFFNSSYPNSNSNFSDATENITVPIISHEVGQYQSYPDFSEIEKYTGNLKADNLKVFQNLAKEAGTFRKSEKFHQASGKWAAKLYKSEIEMAHRTPGIAGYELFGLQDYPGQGTALIGILNTFMESKGFVSPEDWRQSSDDRLILAEFPKFTFLEGEEVEIPIMTVNYSDNPKAITAIDWSSGFDHGRLWNITGTGVIKNSGINLKMPVVKQPEEFRLTLINQNGDVSNEYNFWVYPREMEHVKNVKVTDNLNEALRLLDKGDRVILCPDSAIIANASIGPLYTPDFWNYRMYRSICDEMGIPPSPGTLGLYINSSHPALKKFPSDSHTDFQWFPIIANSRPLIIDRLPKNFDPIVEVIDNVERNFRLSLMLECNVGKGKLIILTTNLDKLSEYPEGRWLLQSVKEYVSGKDFKPSLTLTPTQLTNLVTKPSNSRLIKELKNETYGSKWE